MKRHDGRPMGGHEALHVGRGTRPWQPEWALATEVICAAFHDLVLPGTGKRQEAVVVDAARWFWVPEDDDCPEECSLQWWCDLTGLEIEAVRDSAALLARARALAATAPEPAAIVEALAPLLARAEQLGDAERRAAALLLCDERMRWHEMRLGLTQRRRVTAMWPVQVPSPGDRRRAYG